MTGTNREDACNEKYTTDQSSVPLGVMDNRADFIMFQTTGYMVTQQQQRESCVANNKKQPQTVDTNRSFVSRNLLGRVQT